MAQETQVEVAALPRLLIVILMGVDHDQAFDAFCQNGEVTAARLDFFSPYGDLELLDDYLIYASGKNDPFTEIVYVARDMDDLCVVLAQRVSLKATPHRIVLTANAYSSSLHEQKISALLSAAMDKDDEEDDEELSDEEAKRIAENIRHKYQN